MQEVTNFARFYSVFKRVPKVGDEEYTKRELVSMITKGRTESLKELTLQEYDGLCRLLERKFPDGSREAYIEYRRKRRSICLKLMQQIGVDTTSWNAVDGFCKSKKIAGKKFSTLDIDELKDLSLRLRMILKKKS